MEIITTHANADFDALASMIAAKKLYPDARMIFPWTQSLHVTQGILSGNADVPYGKG